MLRRLPPNSLNYGLCAAGLFGVSYLAHRIFTVPHRLTLAPHLLSTPSVSKVQRAFFLPEGKLVDVSQDVTHIQLEFKPNTPQSVFDEFEKKWHEHKKNGQEKYIVARNQPKDWQGWNTLRRKDGNVITMYNEKNPGFIYLKAFGTPLDAFKKFPPSIEEYKPIFKDDKLLEHIFRVKPIGATLLKFQSPKEKETATATKWKFIPECVEAKAVIDVLEKNKVTKCRTSYHGEQCHEHVLSVPELIVEFNDIVESRQTASPDEHKKPQMR